MIWFKRMALGSILAAVITACGGGGIEQEPLPPGVEEIPVTTQSAEALERFRLGQRYLDIGRGKLANPLFENATGKDPSFSWAYLNAAVSAASVREFQDNLEVARIYLEGKSEGERLLVEIAETYINNDLERRLELSQALVDAYPRSRRAWLARAEVQRVLPDIEPTRRSLDQALELDPSFIATQVAIWGSYLYDEPRDLDRAEHAMRTCLEIEPEEGKFHENLADVQRAKNDLEQARDLYTVALRKDPDLSEAIVKRGHVYSFLGQFEEARADYDAAVTRSQGLSQLSYARFRAYTHLHAADAPAALAELTEQLGGVEASGVPRDQIARAKLRILDDLAAIQLHHGLLDEAAATLVELTAANRSIVKLAKAPAVERLQEADILLWQGRLAARQGDHELARSKAEAYRRLLADDPNPRHDQAYEGLLGLSELLRARYSPATEHLEKSDLTDVYFKYLLALAHEGAGEVDEARQLFQEVAVFNFNSVGFALVRGEALAKTS